MKVTDLKQNECIHCETEEQAISICKLMNEAGLTWNSGDSYLELKAYYDGICFFPKEGLKATLSEVIEHKDKWFKAEQFLKQ